MASIAAAHANELPTIEDFCDDDWKTATVFYERKDPETDLAVEENRLEIVNLATRQRYRYEKMSVISLKAGLLILGIPFYAMVNVAAHVVRLAVLSFAIFYRSADDLFSNRDLASLKKFAITVPTEMSVALFQTVWSLVKAPICAIGMEFCAIGAIVSPITWRVHFASVEAFWRGTDRRHNLNNPNKATEEWFVDFWTNPYSEYGFFLATCFQPWGTLDDTNICKKADGSDRFVIKMPTS